MKDKYEKIADTVEAPDWKNQLLRSDHGLKAVLANAITVLRHEDEWRGAIRFDAFSGETKLVAPPPWEENQKLWKERLWTPHDDIKATDWLQRYGVLVQTKITEQAVEAVAHSCQFHPVIDYLDSLVWDGVERLDGWISRFLGAAPSLYISKVARCSLVAAVARILSPGCKVDTVPILEGLQGALKSSSLRALSSPWFTDQLAALGSKDASMQLRGTWFCEISELETLSRSDVTRVKAFMSQLEDRYRPPYKGRIISVPRSCVFWGTTNSDTYLKDETGARRFWPIKVGSIDLEGLTETRDQLWAEAKTAFLNNCQWWLSEDTLVRIASDEQKKRYIADAWDETITNFVSERDETSVDEILKQVLTIDVGKWKQTDQNRVAKCLFSLGWNRRQVRRNGKQVNRYFPPSDDVPE